MLAGAGDATSRCADATAAEQVAQGHAGPLSQQQVMSSHVLSCVVILFQHCYS